MKKILFGFGGFLILLGIVGIINHISMAMKAVKEEQELYGGSINLMIIQMTGSTIGPYVAFIIGGGLFIAIAFFLNEYQKRNDLTAELIHILSVQRSTHQVSNKSETPSHHEHSKDTDKASTTTKMENKPQLDLPTIQEEERFYWKG